ncbi:MAG: aromatic amino acid transport family protein, partial [Burkholderiales bacterium]
MSNRRFIGSVFMVAGCAMGAGCLAMPMLAAGPNFIFSSLFLALTGLLSYCIASVSLEICLIYKDDVNASTIAQHNFGHAGVIFFALVNCALMYALLSVYMAGGSDLLSKTIFPVIGISVSAKSSLIIFLIITLPVFFKGAELVVKSNKIVFTLKLVSFLTAVILGLNFISPNLFTFSLEQARYLPKAVPIFLTALWFHFLIPVIARLNDYDRQKCRKIFSVGLILPVVLYILWVGIMLSLIPRDGIGNSFFSLLAQKQSLGVMIVYATHNNPALPKLMKLALNLFSNVAMLTSFLTVGISTYDYIRDALKIKQTRQGIVHNVVLTMVPPAFFAIFFPNGFVIILQQAAILLMLINVLMLVCGLKEYSRLE